MLSTLLQIGKKFRESPDGLKHHRYVKQAPQPDPGDDKAIGNSVKFFRVPVNADRSFDFAPEEFDDQYLIEKLYYLNFKTSDADSYKKYIFGDMYRVVDEKTQKESGNFLLGDSTKKGLYGLNSFERAEEDAENIKSTFIQTFRRRLVDNDDLDKIVAFFKEYPNAYLHFDFDGKHWYELQDEIHAINEALLSKFVYPIKVTDSGTDIQGVVLQKALYKTLTTADARVPHFSQKNEYKNKMFDDNPAVMDLLYAIDFSTKAIIRKADIKIIVLPHGKDLTAKQIEDFFTRQNIGTQAVGKKAQAVRDDVTSAQIEPVSSWGELSDELLAAPLEDVPKAITQFDFIFSKAGSGPGTPDIDMIEISGLERSLLERLNRRIIEKREEVEKDRPKTKYPLSIIQSFLNILGDATTAKKKYQNHLLKVLPQIYTGTYYRDAVLLPALIEKTEFNIRNDKASFGLMKYDFYFLLKIQNRKEDYLMEIKNSPSYQVGVLLGRLARQFSGSNSPIKSFEKNYVGLLSRRITTLPDVVRLGNDIDQKLVMHERSHFTFRDSHAFAGAVQELQASGRPYNKDECAFGFFESYFEPLKKKETGEDEPPSN